MHQPLYRIAKVFLPIAVFVLVFSACSIGSAPPDQGGRHTPRSRGSGYQPATELVVADGTHFGYMKRAAILGSRPRIRFDLAYYLTGRAATRAAEAHGEVSPPPGDVYIVNDSPRLRWLPVAGDVEVDLLSPSGGGLAVSNLDALRDLLRGGTTNGFQITVLGGRVVKIVEQTLL